jgi:alkylhydroperoxidase family enzyme
MARVDYIDPSTVSERTQDLLQKNGHKNIFRMLAHSESHLLNYCRLGAAIRHKGELDPVLRELAITRAGILCEADYEIIAHQRIGEDVGVRPAQNAALDAWQESAEFSAQEQAVLHFTDEVVTSNRPSDEVFAAVSATLSPGALVELHLAIGYYVMTSKFLRTFDIDLETD